MNSNLYNLKEMLGLYVRISFLVIRVGGESMSISGLLEALTTTEFGETTTKLTAIIVTN